MTPKSTKIEQNQPLIGEKSAEKRVIPLLCCVPGCRRKTQKWPQAIEFICPEHWKMVPLKTRQHHQRLQKNIQRDPGLSLVCRTEAARAWAACFDAALSAAAGL